MEKYEEMMSLNVLCELPDDDSLGIETCSNVVCHSLKLSCVGLKSCIAILHEILILKMFLFLHKVTSSNHNHSKYNNFCSSHTGKLKST
jgi:hypothetical protein